MGFPSFPHLRCHLRILIHLLIALLLLLRADRLRVLLLLLLRQMIIRVRPSKSQLRHISIPNHRRVLLLLLLALDRLRVMLLLLLALDRLRVLLLLLRALDRLRVMLLPLLHQLIRRAQSQETRRMGMTLAIPAQLSQVMSRLSDTKAAGEARPTTACIVRLLDALVKH